MKKVQSERKSNFGSKDDGAQYSPSHDDFCTFSVFAYLASLRDVFTQYLTDKFTARAGVVVRGGLISLYS